MSATSLTICSSVVEVLVVVPVAVPVEVSLPVSFLMAALTVMLPEVPVPLDEDVTLLTRFFTSSNTP